MLTTPLAGGVAAASAWQAVAMSAMTCPKCRGELEHLIAADDRAHAPAPASASAPPQRLEPRESRRESHRESYDSHHSDSHGSYPRKRKKHWTEELFG